MSTAVRIPRVPRPSRISGYLTARLGPPTIDPAMVELVLARHGLRLVESPRNLLLNRRSRNVTVVTDRGTKVVKRYRPQWTPARVAYGHSILGRLEEVGFPAVRLVRTPDGEDQTAIDDQLFAILDFIVGTNYSLNYLRRNDRLHLTENAGRTLFEMHRRLEGFVPVGEHHLGFVSLTGPHRRDVAWHRAALDELADRSRKLTDPEAASRAARLIERSPWLLEQIERVDGALAEVPLPRVVIHGDFGLHNLIFRRDGLAVPVDFEVARLDWRVNDLVSALGKYRLNGGTHDLESMEVFLRAYVATSPLSPEEVLAFPDAWRLYRLQAAVQYWNSYFETDGPAVKLARALDAIGRAQWVVEHPEGVNRLVRAAGGAATRSAPSAPPAQPAGARDDGSGGAGAITVLQVTRNLQIGGAQESARTMAGYLPRVGCRSLVCTFGDGPLRAELEAAGIPVRVLPGRRHSIVALPAFLAEIVRLRRDLVRLVDEHGVEVVQTRGIGPLDFLVLSLRFQRPLKVVWTIENVVFMVKVEHQRRFRWLLRPKRAAHRWLYRIGARYVDAIVVVSDETERSFRETVGYRGGKVRVVPNGVDVERYSAVVDRSAIRRGLGFGPNDHLMTMVGTFKRQKGHRYLVEAMPSVRPRFPNVHVLLVGEGELLDETRTQVRAAGLEDRVHFLGSRRDVPELLAASDSFVLPSLWEGLPVALVEALASGLPVVATAVSGTSQVMTDGVTGWMVPPGDVDALARAMGDLLADPARAAGMAAAGRERVVASFSAGAQAERLAALFRGAHREPSTTAIVPVTSDRRAP